MVCPKASNQTFHDVKKDMGELTCMPQVVSLGKCLEVIKWLYLCVEYNKFFFNVRWVSSVYVSDSVVRIHHIQPYTGLFYTSIFQDLPYNPIPHSSYSFQVYELTQISYSCLHCDIFFFLFLKSSYFSYLHWS